jgi:micrococcal nuclease
VYEYMIWVQRVVDGDTIHATVDLGCDVALDLTLRLAWINAPEMSTPQGKEAKAALEKMLEKTPIMLHTIKDKREKYGRYLALLSDREGQSINDKMVQGGFAVPYMAG